MNKSNQLMLWPQGRGKLERQAVHHIRKDKVAPWARVGQEYPSIHSTNKKKSS